MDIATLRRWGAIAGIALVGSAGLFGAGFGTGWIVSNGVAAGGADRGTNLPTAAPNIPGFNAAVLMPDVRGLAPDDAKQVLADAGIDVATVTVNTRPSAGLSGLVIAQVPAFGVGDPPTVSLLVSAPATVPNVVGQSATDAITNLNILGAQIRRLSVFVPGSAVGIVTTTDPAPGAPLPEIVTLSVTAAPASVNLATLHITGDCNESDTVAMNGKDWSKAAVCSSSPSGSSASWTVSKAVDQVSGTLGITDNESPGATATVQIMGDGVVLGTYILVRGTPAPFALITTGIGTLSVKCVSTTFRPAVVVGDFTALGSSAAIATLSTP